MSWNIHRGRGSDGRVDPDRVLRALGEEIWRIGTDLLFLQEADAEAAPHKAVLDTQDIERITGLSYLQADRARRSTGESSGFLGATCFLHPNFTIHDVRLVDLPGHCPRGAVIVDATRYDRALRLCNTHLSLSQALRAVQMRTLAQNFRRVGEGPIVIIGDLNEWRPWGGFAFSRSVLGTALKGPARATFPVRRPLLPLDRILTDACCQVTRLEVLDGPLIRAASDHRPIYGEIVVRST